MDKIRVKPLVWNERKAHSDFGLWYAISVDHGAAVLAKMHGAEALKSIHKNEEAAKAAAQSDYEARILAALEPAPVSVQEAAVFLAEHIDKDMAAANHIIDAYVNVTPKTPVRHWLSQCLRALAEKGEA